MKKIIIFAIFLFSVVANATTVYLCYSTEDENLKIIQDEQGYYVEYSLMGQVEASYVTKDLQSDTAELFALGLPLGGSVSVEKFGARADAVIYLSKNASPIVFNCL